jgi:hypothetical protein
VRFVVSGRTILEPLDPSIEDIRVDDRNHTGDDDGDQERTGAAAEQTGYKEASTGKDEQLASKASPLTFQ